MAHTIRGKLRLLFHATTFWFHSAPPVLGRNEHIFAQIITTDGNLQTALPDYWRVIIRLGDLLTLTPPSHALSQIGIFARCTRRHIAPLSCGHLFLVIPACRLLRTISPRVVRTRGAEPRMQMRSDKYMGSPQHKLAIYCLVRDPLLNLTHCKPISTGSGPSLMPKRIHSRWSREGRHNTRYHNLTDVSHPKDVPS